MASWRGPQGDRAQPSRREPIEQAWQNLEDDRHAGGAPCRMAVVQQQNVPAAQPASQARKHLLRIAVDRVEAAMRPGCELELEAAQDGVEKGVRRPAGARKKRGVLP